MRRAANVDHRHRKIADALIAVGCDVMNLPAVRGGEADVLVHRAGRLWLMEFKDPIGPLGGKSRDGQHLNEAQQRFAQRWPVHVVRSPEEAIRVVEGR